MDMRPFGSLRGVTERSVRALSGFKNEPDWMLGLRLQGFRHFAALTSPTWGPDLSAINYDDLICFDPGPATSNDWNSVPDDIRKTYTALGIPRAEQKFLAGVMAQYNSTPVYGRLKEQWEKDGVICTDTDTAIKKYPDLIRQYFGTVVPPSDNKFAALNTALWSGGNFVYVPAGVKVDLPLQACYHLTKSGMGQFERTLIIAEQDSNVHCIESCTAPMLSGYALHAAVFEVVVKQGARVRCIAIQNWSDSVYNLVTKRMRVDAGGVAEWVSGNIGSQAVMSYPGIILAGEGARGEALSLSLASSGHYKDAGVRIVHAAPHTRSVVVSKSISMPGGRSNFRSWTTFADDASNSRAFTRCDSLLVDGGLAATYPTSVLRNSGCTVEHEASINRLGDDQLFYLASRGIGEAEARSLVVRGFIEPVTKDLPMVYAQELNRLINHTMKGVVG